LDNGRFDALDKYKGDEPSSSAILLVFGGFDRQTTGLRRLTTYVGLEDPNAGALVQCAKTGKGYFRPLEEVVEVSGIGDGCQFC
jgi:hypothetical protein